MNLHQAVSGSIQAVNPYIRLIVQVSTGYTTNPDGSRVPSYANAQIVFGDIQALQYTDVMQLDGLNIQGERRKIYISGRVDGLVRVDNKGGDRITTPDGFIWQVTMVLEYWADWVSVAVTLQDQTDMCPGN